jgi:hypothetical protein
VEEFVLVRQHCTAVSVVFDDAAVADYFDQQVDRGLTPDRFARIWIHTHPGASATPSAVDEATFRGPFRSPDWAVMAILARGGACSARLRCQTGLRIQVPLQVAIDDRPPFPAADAAEWQAEYDRCVVDARPCMLELGDAESPPERSPTRPPARQPAALQAAAALADFQPLAPEVLDATP